MFLLLFDFAYSQEQNIILNHSLPDTEYRYNKAILGLEINKDENIRINATVRIIVETYPQSSDVSQTTSLITNTLVGTISDTNNLNLVYFKPLITGLVSNTAYQYKWILESNGFSVESSVASFTTTNGWAVLPNQTYELPEWVKGDDGVSSLIVGDTIGKIKYDDIDQNWVKVQTFYKTTMALNSDGELWAWGRNTTSLVPGLKQKSDYNDVDKPEIQFKPVLLRKEANDDFWNNIDNDEDGFWNIDEEIAETNPDNAASVPIDTDNDKFSDAFEIELGLDPNTPINSNDWVIIEEFAVENFKNDNTKLKVHDFAFCKSFALAIEKDTGHLYGWGDVYGGVDGYDYISDYNGSETEGAEIPAVNVEKNKGFLFTIEHPYRLPWNPEGEHNTEMLDKSWHKVAVSDNFLTPRYPNLNKLNNIYDATAAAITTEGELYVWGIIDGIIVYEFLHMQAYEGQRFKEVSVSEKIVAIDENGDLYVIRDFEIGPKLPTSTLDADFDGVLDFEDDFPLNSEFQKDSDGDGLPDKIEKQIGTNWTDVKGNEDSDGDNVFDGEDQFPLDPLKQYDRDLDGVEAGLDLNDYNDDSDGDGVLDGEDLHPGKKDYLGDQVGFIGSDYQKIGSDRDSDNDGISDIVERYNWTDPYNEDTDGDGTLDSDDKFPRGYYYKEDSDGDGLPDYFEVEYNGTYPNKWDSDDDGVMDGVDQEKRSTMYEKISNLDCDLGFERCNQWEFYWRFVEIKYDCNNDGKITYQEWNNEADCSKNKTKRDNYPSNINKSMDTDNDGKDDKVDEDDDNDGYLDIWELDPEINTDPLDWESQPKDSDFDRIPDVIELRTVEEGGTGTDPNNPNTDGDYADDGTDDWPNDPTLAKDTDKDRIEDWVEIQFTKSDYEISDTDGDGVNDGDDDFPMKTGNYDINPGPKSGTKDSDNDGWSDEYEKDFFDNDDLDNDGTPNWEEVDSDGDGYNDCECDINKFIKYVDPYDKDHTWWEPNWRQCEGYVEGELWEWERDESTGRWYPKNRWKTDAFPKDENEWLDFDGDGIGDNSDNDADDDSILDRLYLRIKDLNNSNFDEVKISNINLTYNDIKTKSITFDNDYFSDQTISFVKDIENSTTSVTYWNYLFDDQNGIITYEDRFDWTMNIVGREGKDAWQVRNEAYSYIRSKVDPDGNGRHDDALLLNGEKYTVQSAAQEFGVGGFEKRIEVDNPYFNGAFMVDLDVTITRGTKSFTKKFTIKKSHRWSHVNNYYSVIQTTKGSEFSDKFEIDILIDAFSRNKNQTINSDFGDWDGVGDGNRNEVFGEDGDECFCNNDPGEYNYMSEDLLGDEIDRDDDGDTFMDLDEDLVGSDSKDSRIRPGAGNKDSDNDGLADNYEIRNDTDPNDWDSDNDGISDGYKSPSNWAINWSYAIEIPDLAAKTGIGDYYYIHIRGGRSESYTDAIKIELTTTYEMTGQEVLSYFHDKINNHYYKGWESIRYFSDGIAQAEPSGKYTIKMVDDFNDGWQGGHLKVTIDGDVKYYGIPSFIGDGYQDRQESNDLLEDNIITNGLYEAIAEFTIPDGTSEVTFEYNPGEAYFENKFYITRSVNLEAQPTYLKDQTPHRYIFHRIDDHDTFDQQNADLSDNIEGFSSYIQGKRLFIRGLDDLNEGIYIFSFNTIHDNGKLVVLSHDKYTADKRGNALMGLDNEINILNYNSKYSYSNGVMSYYEDDKPILRDMFPSDPDEFYDTDGDGIGDYSDDDIDGDGQTNGVDPMPYNKDYNAEDFDKDGIPDSIDTDDDNDWRFDFDESYVVNGSTISDPLNSNSRSNNDHDQDGLSDEYEIAVSSRSNNPIDIDYQEWDSDGDGIADGMRFPDVQDQWNASILIPNRESYLANGQYVLSITGRGNNQSPTEFIVNVDDDNPLTGLELLENWKENLNGMSINSYSNIVPITANITLNRLEIKPNPNDNGGHTQGWLPFRLETPVLVYYNNKLHKAYQSKSYAEQFGRIYRLGDTSNCCSYLKMKYLEPTGGSSDNFLYDMFPDDPKEFWDTDGDGIGDNSDNDIDGDGTNNLDDKAPYDPLSIIDTDGDYIGDNNDNNDDNDEFLDIDDPNPKVASTRNQEIDRDRDGYTNEYEELSGMNPDHWDTDYDGVSDGQTLPNGMTDFNAVPSDAADSDGDGFSDFDEKLNSTAIDDSSSKPSDIDGDYYSDVFEDTYGHDKNSPLDPANGYDSDSDGYFDYDEELAGSSPSNNGSWPLDSDGDGYSDAFEDKYGFNKNDNNSRFNRRDLFNQAMYPGSCCSGVTVERYLWENIRKIVGFRNIELELSRVRAAQMMAIDMFPTDPNEWWDNDLDGIGDNEDPDDDNDGVPDIDELTPRMIGDYYWRISNPYLEDTDGDGVNDKDDQVPWDMENTVDTDGDNRGDINDDWDDDNDGMDDNWETLEGTDPLLRDTDGDGYSDGPIAEGIPSHSASNTLVSIEKFDLLNSSGNWIETIELNPTYTSSSTLAENWDNFRINFEPRGRNNQDDNFTVELNLYDSNGNSSKMTAIEVLNEIKSQVNGTEIKYESFNGDGTYETQTLTANVSETRLIISGQGYTKPVRIWLDWHSYRIRILTSLRYWDGKDQFPNDVTEWADFDYDRIGDNADTNTDWDMLSNIDEEDKKTDPYWWDTDGDFMDDFNDKAPLDPNAIDDMDGDGVADERWLDINGDGFIDFFNRQSGPYSDFQEGVSPMPFDDDIDGDGIDNLDEIERGLNEYDPDFDDDGVVDGKDVYPKDSSEWSDSDSDGYGDNKDLDDDNDGYSDLDELYNKTSTTSPTSLPLNDIDGDFISDEYEAVIRTTVDNEDTDGDGVIDGLDAFPLNSKESLDTDYDGIGNNTDTDDDDDGLSDFMENVFNDLNDIQQFYSGPKLETLIKDNNFDDDDDDQIPTILEKEIAKQFELVRNDSDNEASNYFASYIDSDNVDNDTLLNWNDNDSDNDGVPDNLDLAIFDDMGVNDTDLDFVSDSQDRDIDNDLIENRDETDFGTDIYNADSDYDGVIDGLDFYPNDDRFQRKNQYVDDGYLNLVRKFDNIKWDKISSWNSGQVGTSYAGIDKESNLWVWGVNYGGLPVYQDDALEKWKDGNDFGYTIQEPLKADLEIENQGSRSYRSRGRASVKRKVRAKEIDLGNNFGTLISSRGELLTWGRNLSGQLGNGKNETFRKLTKPNIDFGEITNVSAGDQQTGMISYSNKIKLFGSNDQGQLGTGAPPFNKPLDITSEWANIEADQVSKTIVTKTETFILKTNKEIFSFGDNIYGQLGRGVASTKAENYTPAKIKSSKNWKDIYAISEHVYAFDDNGDLYAWGKNDNYSLGLGIEYKDTSSVVTPTLVTYTKTIDGNQTIESSVKLNEIKEFSPVVGGFAYITKTGELWAAGQNFYMNQWFSLTTPRRIGNKSNWVKFHDFTGGEKNILIENSLNEVWGAGTNRWKVLTDDPCEELSPQVNEISLTHPVVKQKFKFILGPVSGSASLTLRMGSLNLTGTTSGSLDDLVNSLITNYLDANNQSLRNSLTLVSSNTSGTNRELVFQAKNYSYFALSHVFTNDSTNFTGTVSYTDLIENISGKVTYNVVLGGTTIQFDYNADTSVNSATSSYEAIKGLKSKLVSTQDQGTTDKSFKFEVREVGDEYKIYISNHNKRYSIDAFVVNSQKSGSTINQTLISNYESGNCNDNQIYYNGLVKVLTSSENVYDQISLGEKHALALVKDSDGNSKVYSWGANSSGQLGNGRKDAFSTSGSPTLVASIKTQNFSKIKASGEVSFAIEESTGVMYAWGDNILGSLGVGDNSIRTSPTRVLSPTTTGTNGETVYSWADGSKWKTNLGGFRFQIAESVSPNGETQLWGWGYQKLGNLGALGNLSKNAVQFQSEFDGEAGLISTTLDGEYIVVSELLANYIESFSFEKTTTGKFISNSKKGLTSKNNLSSSSGTFQSSDPKFSGKNNSSKSGKNSLTKKYNVGKWKVKKSKKTFKNVDPSASVNHEGLNDDVSGSLSFQIVDLNEKPDEIILTQCPKCTAASSSKGEKLLSYITVDDPDDDDLLTVGISENSQNKDKFSVKNKGQGLDYLYFDNSSAKSNVPYSLTLKVTDWEGLYNETTFEILTDDSGNILIEEVVEEASSGSGGGLYRQTIDSDGDGFSDADEIFMGSDPFDFRDFPIDSDGDGTFDFYDGDIDDDGYSNSLDLYPYDPNEWEDQDNDGIPDNLDNDDDNDGVPDISVNWRDNYLIQDIFPNDPNESSDFDGDGIGDNADLDDDNDGYLDEIDIFPNNPSEWLDTDGDLIGDNSDDDIDNDGYSNFDESFFGSDPFDPLSFPPDFDSDFVPDNIDSDIDGDNIPNLFDNAPYFYNPNQEFIEDNNNFIIPDLPQFFTPNGDGINDTWIIQDIQRYPNNQVWVYDSNGNLIFYDSPYQNDWDGTFNNTPLPESSLLYLIDLDGDGDFEYKGWFYLTR